MTSKPGYWPDDYWPEGYWRDEYWPDYGTAAVPTAAPTGRGRQRRTRFARDIALERLIIEDEEILIIL